MAVSSPPPAARAHISRRNIVLLVLLLIALYVLLPQISSFRDSLHVLGQVRSGWVWVALAAAAGTYLVAAGIYRQLAFKPLRYGRTVLVQLASMFANRLLPAGTGAIGVNYEYLRRQRHGQTQAGVVVAMNNLLGMVGHLLLFVVVLLTPGAVLQQFASRPHVLIPWWAVGALALVVLIGLAVWGRQLRRLFKRLGRQVIRDFRAYGRRPGRMLTAWGLSMILTALYAAALWACAHAVGHPVGLKPAFICLTFGVAAGTVTPTPGGLGGAEAGLTAGLVLYGLSSADALATALLYRALTYWLPLAVGGLAFGVADHRRYI